MVPEPRGVRESMVGWGAEAARPRHLDARVRGQDDQLSSTVPLSSSCKGRRIHPHDFLQTPSSVKGVAVVVGTRIWLGMSAAVRRSTSAQGTGTMGNYAV